jgi:hypothetical protein
MESASGFSLNVLKNSNSLLIGMFGCSLVFRRKEIGEIKERLV